MTINLNENTLNEKITLVEKQRERMVLLLDSIEEELGTLTERIMQGDQAKMVATLLAAQSAEVLPEIKYSPANIQRIVNMVTEIYQKFDRISEDEDPDPETILPSIY
jgi:hypothetical protein